MPERTREVAHRFPGEKLCHFLFSSCGPKKFFGQIDNSTPRHAVEDCTIFDHCPSIADSLFCKNIFYGSIEAKIFDILTVVKNKPEAGCDCEKDKILGVENL